MDTELSKKFVRLATLDQLAKGHLQALPVYGNALVEQFGSSSPAFCRRCRARGQPGRARWPC
eukprot:376768-Amphidinium_carterae.3